MTGSARLAWPQDAAVIAGLQRALWSTTVTAPAQIDAAFGSLETHVEHWTATLTRSPEARFRVLVATTAPENGDPRVVGYGVVHPGADPDVNPVADGELGELAVDPAHRHDGHGSRLLQAVVDTAVADRFSMLRTWLATEDDASRALLTSAGWSPDGAHRELEGPSGQRLRQVRLHTQIA